MAGVFPMDDVVLEESHNGHDTFSDDDCIEVNQRDFEIIYFISALQIRLRRVFMPKDQIFQHLIRQLLELQELKPLNSTTKLSKILAVEAQPLHRILN